MGGTGSETSTTQPDITRSVLASRGAETADTSFGVDLFAVATGGASASERPVVATLPDRFSTRWGDLRLSGKPGAAPTLCDAADGAACERDARYAMPLATRALFRWTYDQEVSTLGGIRLVREPVTIDPETAAALAAWGR